MARTRVRTSVPGDPDALKKELKDSGSDKYFWRVAADTDETVRFMAEPWEFTAYYQHFIDGKGRPCSSDDCKGCDEGYDTSKVWVAPVVDVANSRVRAMQVPKSIVDALHKIGVKQGTIMDRDIIISREGSGKDNTKYSLYPESRKRRDMSIYELPDIEGMLEDMLDEAEAEDDEMPSRTRSRNATKRPAKRAAAKGGRRPPWDEDDEDEDEPPRARKATKKPGRSLRSGKTSSKRSLRR